MFIAIDPGENVGIAGFKDDGSDIAKMSLRLPYFHKYLNMTYETTKRNPDERIVFIMEDFKLLKNKAIDQTGSNMPAPRCIGAVEMLSHMLGDQSRIELVPPGNLRAALKWAGYPELANKPRTWHCPDELSAYAHGVMYLINQGLRKHPIFDASSS